MRVLEAKAIGSRWVRDEAAGVPGFAGAYHVGSTVWLPDDAVLPPSSDVDIKVVIDGPELPAGIGKFIHEGALLEVSFIAMEDLQSPDLILGDYHAAGGFSGPTVISDPTGQLTMLQQSVAERFAERKWVTKRCEQARDRALGWLARRRDAEPLENQVTAWLFGAGVTTHVLLVAALKNPTIRRRYEATQELLSEYGMLDFHESLLETLGCARTSREQVERHLAAVTEAFDTAQAVIETPYRFAADITDAARPVAIGGCWEMVERGFHREAMFWIVATFSRCQAVLAADASKPVREHHTRRYWELLNEIGIESQADIARHCEQVSDQFPAVWKAAMSIIDRNPEIR